MNVLQLAKQRKEAESAMLAQSNGAIEGSVSTGIMGSTSVQRDTEGAGDAASADVEQTDVENSVDPTDPAQNAARGVQVSNGIDPDSLEENMAIDPTSHQAFHMPNPLLVREVVPVAAPKKGPPGSFRAVRLNRFFNPNGEKIVPNEDGFFIPTSQWEFDQLQHFAGQYNLVEYQGDPEA